MLLDMLQELGIQTKKIVQILSGYIIPNIDDLNMYSKLF